MVGERTVEGGCEREDGGGRTVEGGWWEGGKWEDVTISLYVERVVLFRGATITILPHQKIYICKGTHIIY